MEFFKLMNSNVRGKTMENLRNIIDVRLLMGDKGYQRSASKPSFVLHEIFIAVHIIKGVLIS